MGKKLVWNEALAAYDRDLDVLEATQHDYVQFLKQTLADVAERVEALSSGAFELTIWADKELDSLVEPIAEWRPKDLGELGGLVVQVYPGASRGVPGSCCVWLWLDAGATIPRELGALSLLDPLRDAAASLPGEVYDPAKVRMSSEPDVVYLRFVPVELGATDLVHRLVANVVTYCQAAQRMTDDIALVRRSTDPYRWARARLLEVRATRRDELEVKGKWEWDPKEQKLEEWEDGRYLCVKRKNGETDDLWVTAMPNGDVVFAAYGPTTSDEARWQALCSLARGSARTFNDGPGATLLEASAVQEMAAAGKTQEFCDLVAQVFKTFLAG
ncbi:hypothetical protein [Sorangium sp. So ce426]|uniref:hypothetical protein n=1 Tax=Sorangium sp. So ce426 TaxID=3133312 RepID=UPI003F5BFC22